MTSKEYKTFVDKTFESYRNKNKEHLLKGSKYFNEIGSTDYEDIPYKDQLFLKLECIKKLFKNTVDQALINELKIVEAKQINHYRLKTEFATINNPVYPPHNRFGQRKKSNFSWVVDLDEYILIDKDLFKRTRALFDYSIGLEIINYDFKKKSGNLRYLTVKAYKEESMLIITCVDPKEKIFNLANKAIEMGFSSVYIVQNDTQQDTSVGKIVKFFGKECISVDIKTEESEKSYFIGPFTFFQNNITTFETLLSVVETFLNKIDTKKHTLLDMYCGSGLFGIFFAQYFKNVIGIDIDENNINMALKNVAVNNVTNAIYKITSFSDFNTSELNQSFMIIDPPREGLQKQGVENVLKIRSEYLIYVSCNPVTLNSDLLELKNSYTISKLEFFDMFPQTRHIEALCILKRKI